MGIDPEADEEFQRFVQHVRESTVQQMAESAFVTTLNPGDREPDIKLAVETGLAVLMNKPIVVLATGSDPVPPGLERIAHAVVRVSDLDTEAGRMEVYRKLEPFLEEFSE